MFVSPGTPGRLVSHSSEDPHIYDTMIAFASTQLDMPPRFVISGDEGSSFNIMYVWVDKIR